MLRYRGDDGDVVLGIGRVQQGIETTSPRRDLPWVKQGAFISGQTGPKRFKLERQKRTNFQSIPTCQHENGADGQQDEANEGDDALEQHLKLLGVEFAAQVVDKGVNLAQAEHAEGRHVFRGLNRLGGETHGGRETMSAWLSVSGGWLNIIVRVRHWK